MSAAESSVHAAVTAVRRAPARVVDAALGLYQIVGAPLLGRSCRFAPSCSAYARAAVRRHGVIRGGWMAVRRVLRCHPFHAGGWDPVV